MKVGIIPLMTSRFRFAQETFERLVKSSSRFCPERRPPRCSPVLYRAHKRLQLLLVIVGIGRLFPPLFRYFFQKHLKAVAWRMLSRFRQFHHSFTFMPHWLTALSGAIVQ